MVASDLFLDLPLKSCRLGMCGESSIDGHRAHEIGVPRVILAAELLTEQVLYADGETERAGLSEPF